MGFNIVLTAAVNLVFSAVSHFVVSSRRKPLVVGFLVGALPLLCQLNLTTAVFWSQLSKCLRVPAAGTEPPRRYSCERPAVYLAIGLLEGLLFLIQLGLLLLLSLWQELLVEGAGQLQHSETHVLSSPFLPPGATQGTVL